MKIIVIYKSSTGFTERYGRWIAKDLDCEVKSYKEAKKNDLRAYDVVIYGSGTHASLMSGLKKYKELYHNKVIKNLIIFATGATPSKASAVIETIWNNNLSEEERKDIKHFYMQSGLCYEKMSFFPRTLMRMVAKKMSKEKNLDSEKQGFADSIQKSYDISSHDYAIPLVDYVKKLKI